MGQHGSASGSVLLGLDGFEVTAAEVVDEEWRLEVQTMATAVGCAACGTQAQLHARRTVRVRDLPIGGRPVVLAWRKRVWRCVEPACMEVEILAWHLTAGCSNGPTEAVNLLVKKVKRVGHGFRNLANYRLRLLLRCGVRWQTHRTARLRSRSPQVVSVQPQRSCEDRFPKVPGCHEPTR